MFNRSTLLLPFVLASVSQPALAQANQTGSEHQEKMQNCVSQKAISGDESLTLKQIRQQCVSELSADNSLAEVEHAQKGSSQLNEEAEDSENLLSKRLESEQQTQFKEWVITPHKPNYFLPILTSSRINKEAYRTLDGFEENLEGNEAKFQLSLKVPLNTGDMLFEGDGLYLGFTLQAWWQIYASNISKPFRETNYQPEIFYLTPTSWTPFGGTTAFVVGLEHQSNGRGQNLSRSWNRAYVNFLYQRDNFALSLRPWYRLEEDEKEFEFDPNGDDNPDIEDFMGNFELGMVYNYHDYEFAFMGRQNFSTNRGAAELTMSFPLYGKLRAYVSAFNGYGESLIDYNHQQTRVGLGITLNNIL